MIFPLNTIEVLCGNVWTWTAGMIDDGSVNPCGAEAKNNIKQHGKKIPRCEKFFGFFIVIALFTGFAYSLTSNGSDDPGNK